MKILDFTISLNEFQGPRLEPLCSDLNRYEQRPTAKLLQRPNRLRRGKSLYSSFAYSALAVMKTGMSGIGVCGLSGQELTETGPAQEFDNAGRHVDEL